MRVTYKNPKELGSALRDIVDLYRDDMMSFEEVSKKIVILAERNEERLFKNGNIEIKIANVLGEDRVAIVNEILNK